MRKFLVSLIVSFIKIVTVMLNPERRADVLLRVRSNLGAELCVMLPNGKRVMFYDNTYSTFNHVRFLQNTEKDTISWIESMPEDSLLWDIGANIGFFTLYAASMVGGNGVRVVGFEPAAGSYGALNRNIEGNAMANHVVAYCVALASTTSIGRMNMGEVGLGTDAGGWYNGFESELFDIIDGSNIDIIFQQGCVGFSIDDFVEMFQPPLPTHIKMDVDGIEAGILRGGRRTLSATSVRSMIIEMEGDLNSDRNRELFDLMAELGFAPRPKQSPELRNVIFEREVSN